MKSAGKARSNGLYRHIRTSKEIIRNLLNYCQQQQKNSSQNKMDASRKIPGSIHDAKLIVQFYRRCPDNWVHITLEALFAGHVPSSGWAKCRYFIFAR